ncbi:UdgX family uracil-DNA binding protein [Pseudonocardia halophobica]|uniref:UdgX family uracil-DNA binding protein n=1 Tax=Pseudonocardia halophobica TaxID=29401 RepID=UPI003D8AA2FA
MTEPAADAPSVTDLDQLREVEADCTGCELYKAAGPTVGGEGPRSAWLMLVGEQPGDQEDKAGKPFVGPAGRVLDQALDEAGIARDEVFVTNAVKHFRFEERGKRRIHKQPTVRQVRACRPWLDAELRLVGPPVVGVLGAVAAKSLLGQDFRITDHRGELLEQDGRTVVPTVHPSSILRSDPKEREELLAAFVADLKVIAGARP